MSGKTKSVQVPERIIYGIKGEARDIQKMDHAPPPPN